MERIVKERAIGAYRAAWLTPRWAFQHGRGPTILMQPRASAAIEAGAKRVPLGDTSAAVLNTASNKNLAVDGNVHTLVRVDHPTPEDIVVHTGARSAHLDVPTFLDELGIATGIETERIFVHIPATGHIEAAIAPSVAWVDPLVRRCASDAICIQQFLLKWNVGGVAPQLLTRLFGAHTHGQVQGGTPNAIKPFVAPVCVMVGAHAIQARYSNTVAELLDALPDMPVYLHGVQLVRCSRCLWTLSPVCHGVIHLYLQPATQVESVSTIGARTDVPTKHRLPSYVPSSNSFTGNAFAPPLRYTPAQLAQMAPSVPTTLFMVQLTLGEPMTVSRAQCIYRNLSSHYAPHTLANVLLDMALPGQRSAMQFMLTSVHTVLVHPAFETYVHEVAIKC